MWENAYTVLDPCAKILEHQSDCRKASDVISLVHVNCKMSWKNIASVVNGVFSSWFKGQPTIIFNDRAAIIRHVHTVTMLLLCNHGSKTV